MKWNAFEEHTSTHVTFCLLFDILPVLVVVILGSDFRGESPVVVAWTSDAGFVDTVIRMLRGQGKGEAQA